MINRLGSRLNYALWDPSVSCLLATRLHGASMPLACCVSSVTCQAKNTNPLASHNTLARPAKQLGQCT